MFQRLCGILILFRLRKLGKEGGVGSGRRGLDYLGGGRGVMDIPQDEVGHCSSSLVKRAL